MNQWNLYKIERTDYYGYGIYDEAVVIAKDEEEAKGIHPGGNAYCKDGKYYDTDKFGDYVQTDPWNDGTWCKPDKVKVTLIGVSNIIPEGYKDRVICASYTGD